MSGLTRAEAAARSALLTVHAYDIDLDLTGGGEVFGCATTVRFDATAGAGTFVQVRPHALRSAVLNGRPLDPATLSDGRLPLTGLAATNELVVDAVMPYSHDGVGLHRHTDPADGEVYLYAHVAPDEADRLFACFDQPDLKARFTISASVPEDWTVLGTGPASRVAPGRWELGTTPPLATYLVTVVAGRYQSFADAHDGIPLGLHCRASLAEALKADVDELFDITRGCLDEYHALFGVRYPFAKYDQVFVPEFGNLAMENPACVLIRDERLFRGAASTVDREDRAVIIAHEMSHMWFGNLVTMAWWDDLWLNEAFADHMGHRVATEATRFTGARTSFAAGRKGLGYAADERPSTHPLSAPAPDVSTALTHFDYISYFKGSAVVRQLVAVIGEDAFRAGLRRYFQRHAYGNAGYREFLDALRGDGGPDLDSWAEAWLRRANVNTLEPAITVENGRITAAAVRQTAPASHPVLRPHTLRIGLYGPEPATVAVRVDGAHTEIPELIGRAAPRFLLLNDGDLAYAKIRFDPGSLAALPERLPALDPLNRAMVWGALLLAVRDAAYPARGYLDLVHGMLRTETELPIVTEVLKQARPEVADRFLAPGRRPAALAALAEECRRLLAGTDPADERRLTAYRELVDCTADAAELHGWLGERGLPAGIALDPELAWRIRYRLAVLGELTDAEIAAAGDADRSTQGTHAAAKCRAARPDPAAKATAWEAIMSDGSLSNYGVWALAEGFWQPDQAELTAPYVERFFTDLPLAGRLRGEQVLDTLTRLLYPRYAARPRTLRLAAELLGRGDLPAPPRRRVVDCTDDLRRVVAAREERTDA